MFNINLKITYFAKKNIDYIHGIDGVFVLLFDYFEFSVEFMLRIIIIRSVAAAVALILRLKLFVSILQFVIQ